MSNISKKEDNPVGSEDESNSLVTEQQAGSPSLGEILKGSSCEIQEQLNPHHHHHHILTNSLPEKQVSTNSRS